VGVCVRGAGRLLHVAREGPGTTAPQHRTAGGDAIRRSYDDSERPTPLHQALATHHAAHPHIHHRGVVWHLVVGVKYCWRAPGYPALICVGAGNRRMLKYRQTPAATLRPAAKFRSSTTADARSTASNV